MNNIGIDILVIMSSGFFLLNLGTVAVVWFLFIKERGARASSLVTSWASATGIRTGKKTK
jgi:hypothetical protein